MISVTPDKLLDLYLLHAKGSNLTTKWRSLNYKQPLPEPSKMISKYDIQFFRGCAAGGYHQNYLHYSEAYTLYDKII